MGTGSLLVGGKAADSPGTHFKERQMGAFLVYT